jgi:EpsI family protein
MAPRQRQIDPIRQQRPRSWRSRESIGRSVDPGGREVRSMKNMKWTVWLMPALMCGAAVAGIVASPNIEDVPNFLEATVPKEFGKWTALKEPAQIVDPATQETLRKIYKETLSRTYVNEGGERVMLSLARSGNQIGIQQAHIPDVCYPAQGFKTSGIEDGELPTPYGSIPVTRLTATMGSRHEPITYWLTMGDQVVKDRWDKRLVQVRTFLTGGSPGGLLFRVSSIDRDSPRAFAIQQKFVADMMASVSPEARRKLGGLRPPI